MPIVPSKNLETHKNIEKSQMTENHKGEIDLSLAFRRELESIKLLKIFIAAGDEGMTAAEFAKAYKINQVSANHKLSRWVDHNVLALNGSRISKTGGQRSSNVYILAKEYKKEFGTLFQNSENSNKASQQLEKGLYPEANRALTTLERIGDLLTSYDEMGENVKVALNELLEKSFYIMLDYSLSLKEKIDEIRRVYDAAEKIIIRFPKFDENVSMVFLGCEKAIAGLGRFDLLKRIIDRHLELLANMMGRGFECSTKCICMLQNICVHYMSMGRLEDARKVLIKVFDFFAVRPEDSLDPSGIMALYNAYIVEADYHLLRNNYKAAMESNINALNVIDRLEKKGYGRSADDVANVYERISETSQKINDVKSAISFMRDAISIRKKLYELNKENEQDFTSNTPLGVVLLQNVDLDKINSINIYDSYICYHVDVLRLTAMYAQLEEYEKAISLWQECLEITLDSVALSAEKKNEDSLLALFNLLSYRSYLKDPKKISSYFNLALQCYSELVKMSNDEKESRKAQFICNEKKETEMVLEKLLDDICDLWQKY